jgi:cobalt-zinc-cadmium efflux system protein
LEHNHSGNKVDKKKQSKIYFALVVTLAFAIVEFVTGSIFNSLALIADAGHMVTDGIALFIASIATYFASRPASKKYTYGVSKMEITAAILNLLLISFVVFDIGMETYSRFSTDVVIHGSGVVLVAFIGLLVNVVVFSLLHSGHQSLNTRAAKMHVIGDMFGSVAAIFSGAMIYFFNLTIFDPLMSAIVCVILLKMAISLLKEVTSVILDAVPDGLCVEDLERSITNIKTVINIHDLHVWKCTDKEISLTAHLDVENLDNWNEVLYEINEMLSSQYKIEHVTLQPELLEENMCLLKEEIKTN